MEAEEAAVPPAAEAMAADERLSAILSNEEGGSKLQCGGYPIR